jgi:dipeptidyl-peptidase-4
VRYPAAGTANADVSLHVLTLTGAGTPVAWDRARFPYLARVHWSAAGPPLMQVVSRDQRTAQVRSIDTTTGETSLLVEDADPVWVEPFAGVPAWCGDRLVRIADRDDVRALVVGNTEVTEPSLRVRAVVSADDTSVVFTASYDDPSEVHVLRWTADGVEGLTTTAGVHTAAGSSQGLVVTSVSMSEPGARHVVRGPGGSERVLISRAERPQLEPRVAFLRLGDAGLPAGLVLPRDHQPGNALPILLAPYGGPHAQRVLASRRAWLESQWLADQGFAVLVVDGRGTPGLGPVWERAISRNLAAVLDDQVTALHAAARMHPDLDLSRVGIRGWSFGGYLAALAVLRRPDVFGAAVAGAPVTDWSLYDTFYTERYLGTPQDDPDDYAHASLLGDAASLSRPLLIIHGLADDNVVAAHTLLLSQLLTEHGRPHTVLPLTGVTHMTPQESVAENLLRLQVDFLRASLGVA